ncbi:MAG: DEAD/DEAH box helicase domain-containing protein, partial [Paracoccaceae bacterium]
MNPILLDREVRDSFRDLVRGTFGISSPIFRGMIDEFLGREGSFLKGPWITADMPFRSAPEAGEPFPEVPLGFVPHLHQSLAFERLQGDTPKGTLIATGTGSGKTESYLWPILDMCRRRKAEPGIKAILIYPMNALAQDQARRIAKAVNSTPSLQGVRAGMYADSEPESPTDMMGPEDVITRRDAMWHAPPDILLTNYKMLDYLLLRGRDRELWSRNTAETLRFLVVDEIHTFDGAQGADLAMLIRRLKARLGTPPEHLACVGSSATLGADEKAATKLCRYAEDVFGEAFSPEAVIREDRLAPHEVFYASPSALMPPPPAEVRKALDLAATQDQAGAAETLARAFWEEFDPADPEHPDDLPDDPSDLEWRRALTKRLKDADYVRRAFEAVIALGPAASLGEAAERLQSSSKDLKRHLRAEGAAEDLLSAIIALAAWARDDDSPRAQAFLGLRVQTWARELVRMVATLPRSGGEGRRETPQLLHSDDIHPDLAERALPVVRCDHCFTAGYLGRLAANTHKLRAKPKQLYDEWFGGSTRLRIIYYDPLLRRTGAHVRAIAPGRVDAETLDFSPAHDVDPARDPIGPQCSAWLYDPTTQQGKINRECPHCGAHDALFILGLRSARLGASLAGTLFASHFHEETETAKPRMLMFSDSVQDAAHRAAVTESRNAKANQSRALWRAIDEAPGRTMSLRDVAETAPAALRSTLGDETFVARFIAGDMIWREAYRRLVADGAPADPILADDVALRLGWETFSDLTWQSRRTNALVGNRLAAIGFPKERLAKAADRFMRHLAKEGAKGVVSGPDHALQMLRGILAELVARGAVDHTYVRLAQIMAEGAGPNW